MKLIDVLNHEKKYVSMFSKITDYEYGYRAEDLNQNDKYDHNFLLLQNRKFNNTDLLAYMKKKISSGFAVFRYHDQIHVADLNDDAIVEKEGYYGNDINLVQIKSKTNKDIEISVVDPLKDEKFFDFFYEDSKAFGVSYAKGNLERQKQVLSQYKDKYWYLQLTYHNEVIGMLNTFVDGNIAKVDDFVIRDDMQKQGFGSALMRKMVEMLKNKDVRFIYLVTSQNDTPKNMYQSWNLNFISEYYVTRKTLS